MRPDTKREPSRVLVPTAWSTVIEHHHGLKTIAAVPQHRFRHDTNSRRRQAQLRQRDVAGDIAYFKQTMQRGGRFVQRSASKPEGLTDCTSGVDVGKLTFTFIVRR